jgi:signal transduction histidine kinase
MMTIVGGYLTVESPAAGGTQVTISLPLTGRAWGQK